MGSRQRLDFRIDKLTRSIGRVATGEIFQTTIVRLALDDLHLVQKHPWSLEWELELSDRNRDVFGLKMEEDPLTIHGSVSSEDGGDHLFMDLLENAACNKGRAKRYQGVAGNLVTFLCKRSFEKGYGGSVVFVPKTRLIAHYEKALGAQRLGGTRMFIDTSAAYRLVTQ